LDFYAIVNVRCFIMNKKEFIDFARENLLSSHQARHITGQSRAAFNQSVTNGYLKPALELKESDTRVLRLYFQDEVIAYKEKMSDWQAARKK
ncbi:TPA: hypothetical protein ACSKRS_002657, partial [Listeria innocua]